MVNCPVCGSEVDWVTREQAGRILGVKAARISQLIKAGRLPGAVKFQPTTAEKAFWNTRFDSLLALHQVRRFEQGLEPIHATRG